MVNNMRQIVPYALIFSGILLSYLYLFRIEDMPIIFLFIGTLLQSLAILIHILETSTARKSVITIPFAMILMWSTLFINMFRFKTPYGNDLIFEISVARHTLTSGWNPLLIQKNAFFASLSITILPSVITTITGLPVEDIMPSVILLLSIIIIPIVFFKILESVTNDFQIRSMATIFLAVNFAFILITPTLLKTTFALIFSLFMLLSLLRRGAKWSLLSVVFASSVITSHYTFALLVGAFLFIGSLTTNFLTNRTLTTDVIRFSILYIVMFITWLMYVAWSVFLTGVSLSEAFFQALTRLIFEERGVETTYLFSSPRPITGLLLNLQNGLIVIGVMYGLYNYLRRNIKPYAEAFWLAGGLFSLGILALWLFLPALSIGVDTFRIYYFGLPFLCFWLAFLMKKLLSHRYLTRLFVMIFILLLLPANLMLSEYESDLRYVPSSALSTERLFNYHSDTYRTEMDEPLDRWIAKNMRPGSSINVDLKGFFALANAPLSANIDVIRVGYPHYSSSGYLLIHKFFRDYQLWASSFRHGRILRPHKEVSVTEIFQTGNILYNSGEYILLAQ